jgi:hypothetical protein
MFMHSTAFGQYGSMPLELMQIDACEPAHVRDAMASTTPTLHHVACAVSSLDSAIEELAQMGIPAVLRAEVGDIEFSMHDSRRIFGHLIELHVDSAGFRAFFQQVYDASMDWDGRDPIREPSQ